MLVWCYPPGKNCQAKILKGDKGKNVENFTPPLFFGEKLGLKSGLNKAPHAGVWGGGGNSENFQISRG
jgi:hypothetical protein